MGVHDSQVSFAGGEIAPEAQGRVDIAKYKTALKTMRNFLPGNKGQAYNRPGTSFVGVAKYSDRKSRLIPFVFSTDQAYMLEFGDLYIRFYRDGGEILEDTYNSQIDFWDTAQTYSLNQYVLLTRTDFKIYLYKSLKYANIAQNPETSPTYWSSLVEVRQWNSGTTYASGDYVYENRSDGKRKTFISKQSSNTNHDPLAPTNSWLQASPPVYSSTTTYSVGDYISFTDGLGNVSIYRSIRNANTGHDYFTETLWWQFWNGALFWDVATTYSIDDFVIELNGGVYQCFQSLINSNVGHDPASNGTVYWTAFDAPDIYEISTPYAWQDLPLLKYVQSADTLYIVHKDYAPMLLQRTSDNDWTLSDYAYSNGPFRTPNTDIAKKIYVYQDGSGNYHLDTTGTTGYDYFVKDMEGALFQLNYSVQATDVHDTFTGTGISANLTCGGTWRFLTGGTWDGIIVLEQSTDGGTTWTQVAIFNNPGNTDGNINTFGSIDNSGDPFLLRLNCTSFPSVGACEYTLSADSFNQVGVFRMDTFTDARHSLGTPIKNIILSQQTFDWAEGSWSTYRGWPETITFVQDRLCFGGNNSEPQTLWFTKSSNYTDFGRSSPLVDSDGITVNLVSRQMNRIKSLVAFLNSLLCFTGSGEFAVNSDTGPITPTTISSKVQGLRGIGDVDALMVGNRVVFTSPLGSCLRDLVFNFYSQSFDSENISSISSHLFDGYTIVDLAYQQEPDSIIWMVRSDGDIVTLTYQKEQELIAFARQDTGGDFESVASIPGTSCNEVWFIVNRGTLRCIERMIKRTSSTDPTDQYFVDCGLSYDGTPASTLTGLDHLNGLTVAINAEGFVLPQQVVSNGQITLDKARSKVIAGLPYLSDIETLNPEIPMRDGTLQDRKYAINMASIRFVNTIGGYVGADTSTLDPLSLCSEPPMRDPSLSVTTPTPIYNGYVKFTYRRNNDNHGHVCIRQVDPMPMTLIGIYPIVEPAENP